jgi:hypothetical protein
MDLAARASGGDGRDPQAWDDAEEDQGCRSAAIQKATPATDGPSGRPAFDGDMVE